MTTTTTTTRKVQSWLQVVAELVLHQLLAVFKDSLISELSYTPENEQ